MALRQFQTRGRGDGEGTLKAPAGRAVRGRKASVQTHRSVAPDGQPNLRSKADDVESGVSTAGMVKGYCIDAGLRVVDPCMQILGGRGLAIADLPKEMCKMEANCLRRDAKMIRAPFGGRAGRPSQNKLHWDVTLTWSQGDRIDMLQALKHEASSKPATMPQIPSHRCDRRRMEPK